MRLKVGKHRNMSIAGLAFWILSVACLFGYPIFKVYDKYFIEDPKGALSIFGLIFLGMIAFVAMLYFIIVALRTPAGAFRTIVLTALGVGCFMGFAETAIRISAALDGTVDMFRTFAEAIAGAGALNLGSLFFDKMADAAEDKKKLGL